MEKAYSGKSVTFQDSNSKYTYLCIRQLFSCLLNLLNINEITKKKHIFVTNFKRKLHIFVTNFEEKLHIFVTNFEGKLHIFVTNFEGKLHIFVTNFEDYNFITIFYSRMVDPLLYASAISLPSKKISI